MPDGPRLRKVTRRRLHEPDRIKVRLRAYPIISERVETALFAGWTLAHAATAHPGENAIRARQHAEVMAALCSVTDISREVMS